MGLKLEKNAKNWGKNPKNGKNVAKNGGIQ